MNAKVPDFAGNLKSFKRSVAEAKRLGRAFNAVPKASGERVPAKTKLRKDSPKRKAVDI